MACVRCVCVCVAGGAGVSLTFLIIKRFGVFGKTQQAFACSKSTIEKLENGVK